MRKAIPASSVEHLVFHSCARHCLFTNTCNDVDGQHHILQLRLERDHAAGQFPENDTQAINVAFGRVGDSRVLHSLRGNIGHDAKESSFGGVDGLVDRLAETKVRDESLACSIDENVARMKISVEDVFAVNKVQATGDFPGQPVLCQPGDGHVLGLEVVL